MVFPSLPIYLDPPNWSQQQPNQQAGTGTQNSQAQRPPSSMVAAEVSEGGFEGSIRPGSMADRARLAKVHQADASMKCPRCESTNTKFCYYNNYSLSQPRHFCKTCRRYWTRGGALRSVPVGGGCRRNKRSKGNTSSSKSPLKHDRDHCKVGAGAGAGSSSASANSSSTNGCTNSDVNVVMGQHLSTQFPLFASLQHYSNSTDGSGLPAVRNPNSHSSQLIQPIGYKPDGSYSTNAEFQIGNSSSSIGNNNNNNNGSSMLLSSGIGEQWRFPNLQQFHHHHQQQQQQFPFMTNLEPQIGLFQFGHGENSGDQPPSRCVRSKAMDASSVGNGMMPQVNTIKLEENNNQQGLSLPKNLLSGSGNNELFWNGSGNNAWSEVPSFMTPSPSHLL